MTSEVTASSATKLAMMEPFRINNVTFKNRVLRSAIGGKLAYFDGTVSPAWTNFERRFAVHGIGGIISTTMSVDEKRWSPLAYPKLSNDRFIAPVRDALRAIKAGVDCAYIMQIGDPGYHTQTSLFSQPEDARSSSAVFDFLYGYRSHAVAMTSDDVAATIQHHAAGVRRARDAGSDGVEITASKGYLIHQFLNPGINRREDAYGGSTENRFRLLREIVTAARKEVGRDFLLGVRLSAVDYNYLPVNLRLPIRFPLRNYVMGNGLPETTYFAQELEKLGVDYLHITRGFGFINPKENPGDYPLDQIRIYANSMRHLSWKAWWRATILNTFPDFLLKPILGIGWRKELGANAEFSAEFKKVVKIPVITNGGFQNRELIERTLAAGKCDMVSMARPLLANPNLLELFRDDAEPKKPCTFCNRCVIFTAVQPVGCYDPTRFGSQDEMEEGILRWTQEG